MYDRKYEKKTQKSGLRISKSSRKIRYSNRILMFTEKLNKKNIKKKLKENLKKNRLVSCTQPKNELKLIK